MSFKPSELISLGRAYLDAKKALRAYTAYARREGFKSGHASHQWLDMACKCSSFVVELECLLSGRNRRAYHKFLKDLSAECAEGTER